MKKILGLLILISTFTVLAQENGENKLGSWHMYFGTNRITNKLSIHTEAQLRYYEQAKNFNQLLLRTGLNYHIDSNTIATFGYGYITTDASFMEFSNETHLYEHRIFERFFLKNKVWEFNLEHRYILEQRFLDYGILNDVQHRIRYRLQLTLPLTNTFFLNFYDEIMVNLQDDFFNQNRLYAALGINVTDNMSLQLGYLKNQFSSLNYERLQIGITYNPDLRSILKKK
ncbi:DUF2490 domain-containing protein [Arenibacter sp. TNZ]|jgi:hypothetical protein|uniref:DUF2490 domain-containing protein n=1 Tax=Arenibacter TaxID=178469 RepID=UPI000CD46AA2|nr:MULTISPECIES: DUF2490 domain-containing protein [Arenibacter]MCM4171663.1 DUF2490 domain-containing protein [Arenibacter sp. TNZ]